MESDPKLADDGAYSFVLFRQPGMINHHVWQFTLDSEIVFQEKIKEQAGDKLCQAQQLGCSLTGSEL